MSYRVQIATPAALDKPLNLWSQPSFMQAVARLHTLEPLHLICYKGEHMVALLPVYEKKTLGYRSLKSLAGSYYQGLNLWLEPNSAPARQLLDTLQIITHLAEFIRQRYKRLQFNLSPSTLDIRGFTWEQLKAKPLYTFTHDFTSELCPLPDERKKISLAAKQGYEFGEKLEADEFMGLAKGMNERKSREPGFSYGKFAAYLSDLHTSGYLRQFNLCQNGKIVSSNILLQDGNQAYTVFRATTAEALKAGASGLHTMKLVELLKQESFTLLDFCGGNVPEVARFKAALGLQLRVFYQIYS